MQHFMGFDIVVQHNEAWQRYHQRRVQAVILQEVVPDVQQKDPANNCRVVTY